ncbi:MFS transporter [Sphingomonas colocasiae]|uniref:MFS transporter n=2 Tax=Sphingomonas colocasiae TaxID=1848973 RepID=A0ABS7PVN6_9SPHN|nr:MFS transporter [Sphingomonas colocasiae]
MVADRERRRDFGLLFVVMLTVAAGNTAMQSVLPALGRSLGVMDSAVAAAFSVSAAIWVFAAPFWAKRLDRYGQRRLVITGMIGFTISTLACGLFLAAGILGWITPAAAFLLFILGRLIYGAFGSATPPAAQAMVAVRTTRAERTKALTLLASAFGLGTILGPALSPYLLLPVVTMAGPAFVFTVVGIAVVIAAAKLLPDDRPAIDEDARGAAVAYPTIGGQSSGASVTAATAGPSRDVRLRDARIWPWMLAGLVMGHAQAMTGQTIGFLLIDRLGGGLSDALQSTGLVLMMGAGAALLAQWGLIPILNLAPRALILIGLALSAAGCVLLGIADSLHGIATAYALASLGFGFVRPGFTAGSSLAVGANEQGSVAGKTTAINGAAFVFGPSLGVGLYEVWRPLPYGIAAAALVLLMAYVWFNLRPSAHEA